MKKTIVCILIFLFCGNFSFSQNLLPLVWKISFNDTVKAQNPKKIIDTWQEVNLLLSWERQGYFGRQGKCCLANDFIIPGKYQDSAFALNIALQCNVQGIYINGNYIGGNLPNQFWSQRDAKTVIEIPKEYLRLGDKNRIEIFASELSYTGGISHNYCSISPLNASKKSDVKIVISKGDHVFNTNEALVTLKYKALQNGVLTFCIKNDFHETLVQKSFEVLSRDSTITINLKKNKIKPGFYECTAIMQDIGYSGDAQWFAVSPEKIDCKTETVSGFKEYWDNSLLELHKIHPEFKMRKVDSLSIGSRQGYIIEMKSLGNLTIRGYYFVPRTPGKHPALLHLPGYGDGFQNINSFIKSTENVIELALCVRGHGISADVFNPGFDIPGIWGYKLCSEQENAYRGIYMDCVRAVEFLLDRSEVDPSHIGVMGGSQGGGLALATAGLCKNKIAACAYFDPFPCDIKDFINIRTICKTEIRNNLKYYNNSCSLEQAMHVQDLIDTKGFANWIICPVYFASSLFDDDCPPHIGFATYNKIKTTKQYKIYPNDSHLGESDYYKGFMAFFKKQFKF